MKHFSPLTALIFFLLPTFLFSIIPDNSTSRQYLSSLLKGPVSQFSMADTQILRQDGHPVSFEVEYYNDKLYLIFKNMRAGEYPLIGSGNVVIRRSTVNGDIEQVKLYFDDIGAIVMRIRPEGRRSRMSISLFDEHLYDNLPLGITIEDVLTMSVSEIMVLSSGLIHWEKFLIPTNRSVYERIIEIVQTLRPILPNLPDTEDGAMDSNGNLVRIETLGLHPLPGFNCSGFAKFVADGVYSQLHGSSLMDIEQLKVKHTSLRGNDISELYEETRDPYFGLDWTRNIATIISSMQKAEIVTDVHSVPNPESSDVRGITMYPYMEDIGYEVDSLVQILYLQSLRSPGLFYLGSINGEFGESPQLWQHYHIVTLYPYFDDDGRFHIAVMERNFETSVTSLQERYSGQFIHLVGIRPEEQFIPPVIPGS